jgi:dCMP deaminase
VPTAERLKQIDHTYLRMASEWGSLSRSARTQVGCLVVRGDHIISDGYNGTPSGFDNRCEDSDGKTKPEVLHAESNAVAKLARSTMSSVGSTVYTTVSPCLECAKLLIQAQVSRVVFAEHYRDAAPGIALLRRANIQVTHCPDALEEPLTDWVGSR